jgi:hypothetical protein
MKGWSRNPQPLGSLLGTKPGHRRRLGKHTIEIGNSADEIWDHGEGDVMRYGVDSFSPSSWEPQEEGLMNIAARFSLS